MPHTLLLPPTAEHPLLLDEHPGVLEGLLVLTLEPPVHHRVVQDRGDEVVANALNLQWGRGGSEGEG